MVSYKHFFISILFHVIIFLIFSFSLPNKDQFSPKKINIGQSINAISINESEINKEIQRIRALKNKSKRQEEARLKDLKIKVSSQEKKLKILETKKKNAEERQKRLIEQSDVAKKEISKFRDKKKKEQEALELVAKNRTLIENKNKELQEQNKKLQQQLAENQLFEQIEREEKIFSDESENTAEMDIIDLYAKRIESQIKSNFKILPGQEGLSCIIKINLVRDGNVIGVEILKSSGDSAFDRAAENSVFAVSPFPVPESDKVFNKMREITFVFSP